MAMLATFHLFVALAAAAPTLSGSKCRTIPGDAGWPSTTKWQSLNDTISGRLIATVPLPTVCHEQPFTSSSNQSCEVIKKDWLEHTTFIDHPAEFMNPFYQNQTCSPFTAPEKPCELGNYASYSVQVQNADDVVAAVRFVHDNNVRLTIKNTGHDYAGKSTGKGALSLWTHKLDTIEINDSYQSPGYKGPAAKLGAGVVGGIAYETIGKAGYRIMGGTCQTVGLAGGYTSGGGHSVLNGLYGMAADAVLEWEVVTAQRQHLIATPTKNADLYWALSGGGAGTYAIVLSMTTKIFPEGPVGAASLAFNITEPHYWDGVEAVWSFLPQYVDVGPNTWDFGLTPTGFSTLSILIPEHNDTASIQSLFDPLLAKLQSLGIKYDFKPGNSPSYLDFFSSRFGEGVSGAGPANIQLTSRLIPRDLVANATTLKPIVSAMKALTDAKLFSIGCHALNVATQEHPPNAVLPQWRTAVANCNIVNIWNWTLPWDEMLEQKELLVGTLLPGLEKATDGGGTYLNEVDAQWKGGPRGWKEELYGVNYEALMEVKRKWDPESLLYAWTAVGSDDWERDGEGRLCKVEQANRYWFLRLWWSRDFGCGRRRSLQVLSVDLACILRRK